MFKDLIQPQINEKIMMGAVDNVFVCPKCGYKKGDEKLKERVEDK